MKDVVSLHILKCSSYSYWCQTHLPTNWRGQKGCFLLILNENYVESYSSTQYTHTHTHQPTHTINNTKFHHASLLISLRMVNKNSKCSDDFQNRENGTSVFTYFKLSSDLGNGSILLNPVWMCKAWLRLHVHLDLCLSSSHNFKELT